MRPEQDIVVDRELLAWPRSEDREVVMAYRPTWTDTALCNENPLVNDRRTAPADHQSASRLSCMS